MSSGSGNPVVLQAQPQQVVAIQPMVIAGRVGNCPRCGIGNLDSGFSCLGICLAIFFFPIGVLCCLFMRTTQCSHCSYIA